ncbi:MAG TPA: hypothetical protein VMV00_00135 [Candidatus Baltobacteraceae bacterium]|nr:hypothetical protein [Candidatus Baltobacteraceae bacterium]
MLRNIYESKNYKALMIIPIALLLISLYFIPKIQSDSSLKGGISVQLQTNSTLSVQQITSLINSKIPGAQASVSKSGSLVGITIAINTSVSKSESVVQSIYALDANYSSYTLNLTANQTRLAGDANNVTLITNIAKATAGQQKAIAGMNSTLAGQLVMLKPFLNGTVEYNSTNATAMLNTANSAYGAALANYENYVVGAIKSVVPTDSYSYNPITPTLGAFFLNQIQTIIIAAFVLVAIAVLAVFRTPIPAFAVVFGAANDMIVALGAMGAFGIPLGVASVGGLLMIIGYAIDTDMLASIRVLKRSEGSSSERAFEAMKTGVTMTITAIIAFAILFIMAWLAYIPTYFEISGVVLVGLVADLATTWLGNVPMVLWYKHRKEARNR